jgi:cyclophilin family peptidyl-prolyl cis-trans isomerase
MSNPRVTFETSKGSFVVEVLVDQMPVTGHNFLDLCRNGFYNGLHFHRVIDGRGLLAGEDFHVLIADLDFYRVHDPVRLSP